MTATSTIVPVLSRETSAVTAPTQFIETRRETYAYRRFGAGSRPTAGPSAALHRDLG